MSPMTPPWTIAATDAPAGTFATIQLDPGARARGDVLHRLGALDDVPALLREDLA